MLDATWPDELAEHGWDRVNKGSSSRQRDCHSTAAPSPFLVGVSSETMRECQQNDSLADGQGWSPSGSDPQTKLAVPDQAVLQRLECVGPAVLASLKACLVATLPAEEQSRRSLFFGKLAAWLESIGGVWSEIPIWDTSCCCHPLTGVPMFASGPRR